MRMMKTENKPAEASPAQKTKNDKRKNGSLIWIIISAAIFAILLAVDLVGKHYAVKYLTLGKSVEVIKGVFSLTLVYNKGMAFGFLDDTVAGMVVVTAVTVVLMAVIVIAYVKTGLSRPGLKIILCVIEAGAVGNLVDRILMFTGNLEGVRDFLDISSVQLFSFINGGFNFGICNPADFCVSLGCVALIVYMIYRIATEPEKDEDEVSPAAERSEIYRSEYVEKDVSSLEEISVETEEPEENSSPEDEPENADETAEEDKESE